MVDIMNAQEHVATESGGGVMALSVGQNYDIHCKDFWANRRVVYGVMYIIGLFSGTPLG